MTLVEMRPIGFVRSSFKEKFATPRQPGLVEEAQGRIVLEPWVQPEESLAGLESFSHIWVIFHFHRNSNKNFRAKVLPPRSDEKVGLFASRSPHRPNPIGLSAVRLEKIEGPVLWVSGLDLIDGTPVLDLKPYLPDADVPARASGGWSGRLPPRRLEVEWSERALGDLAGAADRARLRPLIEKSIAMDPRPKVLKGDKGLAYKTDFSVHIEDWDVKFRYLDDSKILITHLVSRSSENGLL